MDRIISKILSGRFILTIICGVVFAYISIVKILPPEAVAVILTMVFKSYFERKRKEEEK